MIKINHEDLLIAMKESNINPKQQHMKVGSQYEKGIIWLIFPFLLKITRGRARSKAIDRIIFPNWLQSESKNPKNVI